MEPSEIEQLAIRLLAQREHSREELRRKLQSRGAECELLEQVLDGLQQQRLQSDERFVEQYVESRRRKGYGPIRIRQELRQRGLDDAEIDAWLDPRDEAWEELMREAAQRKYGSRPVTDYRERARRARFLEYRGFEPGMIRAFLWSDE